jgi:DNA-binding GntR family transcriptional regulator
MRTGTGTQSTSTVNRRLRVLSAPEAAAQAIRDAIIVGEIKTGERLVEQKWAAAFGIGQPTLREALQELEHQGIVRKVPQKGTYVSELSKDDFRLVLEARMPLESIAFKRAAPKVTPEIASELSALVMQMGRAGENYDLVAFHECDVAFHRRVWDLAGNPYLRECLESICLRLFVFSVVGRERNWFRAAVQQHLGFVGGLCSRDPQQAEAAFISQTTHYWSNEYHLDLGTEAPAADSTAPERVQSATE